MGLLHPGPFSVQPSALTPDERERLTRYKRAYQASAHLGSDQQTGNRIAFLKWLVATGDVDEDGDRCIRCRRVLRFPIDELLVALGEGYRVAPWVCRCGQVEEGEAAA